MVGTGGELSANLCDVDFNSQISVFQGSCETLACVGGTSTGESTLCPNGRGFTWETVAFETYMIAVHGVDQAVGSFSFSVEDMGGVPSFSTCDEAAGPLPIGQTSMFSAQSGIEISSSLFASCDSTSSGDIITTSGAWLYIEGDGSQITASMCNNADGGMVAVFSGPSCSELECVGEWSGCFAFFESLPGQIYRIYATTGDAEGQYELSLNSSGPPPTSNDSCDGAIPLEVDGDVVTGTTVDATVATVPNQFCGNEVVAPGVWFSVQGTGQGIAVGLCIGTTYDTIISVFEGTCDGLVCVGGNDDFCDLQSAYNWLTKANTTYYVLVHGFDPTDVGEFGIVALTATS